MVKLVRTEHFRLTVVKPAEMHSHSIHYCHSSQYLQKILEVSESLSSHHSWYCHLTLKMLSLRSFLLESPTQTHLIIIKYINECLDKCNYCNLNVITVHQHITETRYQIILIILYDIVLYCVKYIFISIYYQHFFLLRKLHLYKK